MPFYSVSCFTKPSNTSQDRFSPGKSGNRFSNSETIRKDDILYIGMDFNRSPMTATFSLGDFSALANITPGSSVLVPVGSWDNGIRVTVVAPEPAMLSLLGSCGLALLRRKRVG